MKRPGVTFFLPFSGMAGGVQVACQQSAGLRQRGWDSQIFSAVPAPSWFNGPDPGWRQFEDMGQLAYALRCRRGIKIATWAPGYDWIVANLVPGDRGYLLLQDFDFATYCSDPGGDRLAVHALEPITESRWVQEQLKERYGIDGHYVGIGLNPVFRPLPMFRERLRVLTPARMLSTGRADLKGWDIAQTALRLASQTIAGLSLVTFSVEEVPPVDFMPHAHLAFPNDRFLRELYCGSGIVLVTSRHEGFSLVSAEALACQAPLVCTNADGNMEFCHQQSTCLVGQTAEELADHIVTLAGDPALADRLGRAGHELVQCYQWPAVIDKLEQLFLTGSVRGPS